MISLRYLDKTFTDLFSSLFVAEHAMCSTLHNSVPFNRHVTYWSSLVYRLMSITSREFDWHLGYHIVPDDGGTIRSVAAHRVVENTTYSGPSRILSHRKDTNIH